ncbi:hypothetical protein DICPUDRAFT_156293 [Dictyostelium purpureum]|uniref:ER membrane protein complex subunit 10 n=1 Tax=Dictyostelium purpureum TaxID=5786 RepID=F0ZW78_DICPU|nr:uncharacterized protein DICPUDRAFT_156293 [Dictyostelium purpureum]EGC31807.1 hypothetical protein DICPUDRAFT_156293 [Dictyostelium purpureum]|eukprot:XP_003291674.1 hypothetical protein DICPUDRAFT_156293 [Dictyostelium purpureum]
MINRILIIFLIIFIINNNNNVNSISVSNLHSTKDIEFTMYHNEDKALPCTVVFKPKLIPHSTESISFVDSVRNRKAFSIKCTQPLSKENRNYYFKSGDLFKTTVFSDRQPNSLTFSSLPKSSLNDSSLQYEFLKINLDSNNFNVLASNYQLKKTTPVVPNKKTGAVDPIYVRIEFSEDVLKMANDEPKLEKEKKEEKEKEENQSFIGKYWYYLLPIFLVMLVNLIAPPPQQQGGGAQGGGAPAKR